MPIDLTLLLRLSCDARRAPSCSPRVVTDTGRTAAEARLGPLRAGWLLEDDVVVCPDCAKAGVRPEHIVKSNVAAAVRRDERNRCVAMISKAADEARAANRKKAAAELDMLARDMGCRGIRHDGKDQADD